MSVDIPRYPNPCLTTQARNPVKIIDLPTHQSYSTKQQNPPVCIKEQTSTFRDFLMNKVHKPKRSHAKQFEQYREYFKTKQISHLLSCAEAKPNKDSSFDPNANDTGLNEKTTELSLDLSRFKVHIPFTRDVYLSRKAKSVGRRAPLEKTGFVPILAELEEKEANEKETLETDTDLLERQTSMPGDTQRRSDRELDLSRNRDDSKNKLVFSDVPKLYANLRTLHKNYAQNNESQIENEDSGILTDNLKSGGMSQVMEKRENKRLPAIGNITISDMRSKSEKKGLKVARNNSVENNSDRENKVDVADKIRNLIYEEYSIVEDEEGQQQIRDHLKVKMQRFYSPKRRNKSAEPTGPNATPNHGRSVILENRGNSSTKNLNTEDASINSPGKAKNKEDSFMGVPDWLGTRRDFEDGFKKFAEGTSKRILGICSKQSNMRTPDEITTVVEWLQNVKFFAYLPTTLFRNLAEKVRYRRYEKDENLCVVGDVGDCLYIIYEGLVKCYVNGSEVAKYVKFDTPGQAALTGARIRTATLTATATTDVLRLEVKDYLAIMKNFVEQEKEEIIAFLKNISIFNRLNDQQIRKVADRVQTKKYAKGERIYAEGDGAESFFILRQGLLKIETILSIEKHNIWPTALREWTKSKLERKVKFWNPINPKEFFGEIELLKNCRRLNSVVCDKDSQLLILNKADFFGCLGAKELNDLMNASKNNTREDPDTLRSKLLKEEQKKKEMRDVIAGNWTTQLRTLNELELSKRRRKVVEPVMERFNDNLKSFIRENTYKARKIELKVDCNYD